MKLSEKIRRHRLIRQRCIQPAGQDLLEPQLVTFFNPYSYGRLLTAPRNVLSPFTAILPDGISLAWVLTVLRFKKVERRSFDFTSLAPPVFKACAKRNVGVAVVGGEDEDLDDAMAFWSARFSGLPLRNCRNGFFKDDAERVAYVKELAAAPVGAVIIGMGTPVQEEFAMLCLEHGVKAAIYTCGGFITQSAKSPFVTGFYPKNVDRFHLRAFWRIYKEPHTRRRYFLDYPLNLLHFLCIDALSRLPICRSPAE